MHLNGCIINDADCFAKLRKARNDCYDSTKTILEIIDRFSLSIFKVFYLSFANFLLCCLDVSIILTAFVF